MYAQIVFYMAEWWYEGVDPIEYLALLENVSGVSGKPFRGKMDEILLANVEDQINCGKNPVK